MKLKENEVLNLISKTKENLKLSGRSDDTIRNYSYALQAFFKNCDYEGNLEDFTEEDFMNYIRKEFLAKNKSANTYNFHISAIKKMFIVCFRKEFINELIPRVKTSKRLPVIVSKKDFLYILNIEKNLKHKCWLLLSFCCGLRACEVASLKIENIHSDEHYLIVIGKGNKERKTILPNLVIKFLRLYYKKAKMTKTKGYLFEGNSNNQLDHISKNTIKDYFVDLKEKNNLDERYTLHSLRHSFATYFLMNGGKLEDLQQMMGHEHITSTVIYLHLSQNFNNMKGINHE